jgi:hypothetical protein
MGAMMATSESTVSAHCATDGEKTSSDWPISTSSHSNHMCGSSSDTHLQSAVRLTAPTGVAGGLANRARKLHRRRGAHEPNDEWIGDGGSTSYGVTFHSNRRKHAVCSQRASAQPTRPDANSVQLRPRRHAPRAPARQRLSQRLDQRAHRRDLAREPKWE